MIGLQIKTFKKKALYDIIQYLPLDKLGIKDKYNIIDIVNQIVMKEKKWDKIKDSLKKEEKEKIEAAQKAIAKNLQAIEAILKERPELGEARNASLCKDKSRYRYPREGASCTKGIFSFLFKCIKSKYNKKYIRKFN